MDTSSIREKDLLRITMDDNGILVEDLSNKLSVRCPGLRKELENIILSGGLIKFVKLQRGQKEGC